MLWFPFSVMAQNHFILPPCLEKLREQKTYYIDKQREEIIRMWEGFFHYETTYSRAILDSLEIMCIPTFEIQRKYRNQDLTRVQDLLWSLKPCNYCSNYFLFNNNQYTGGLSDIGIYCHPGIFGDSLAHTKFMTEYEQAAITIRKLNPISIFNIRYREDIWLILPDHSLLVYDLTFDRFYTPQAYLNRTKEETMTLFKGLIPSLK